jgi:hypothetical protein
VHGVETTVHVHHDRSSLTVTVAVAVAVAVVFIVFIVSSLRGVTPRVRARKGEAGAETEKKRRGHAFAARGRAR